MTILKMKLAIFDITEMAVTGHSVLRNIIVQELAQRDLERPTFN